VLTEILYHIDGFFDHLESYTEVPPTAAMTNIMVKITTDVLSLLAISTKELAKEIKQGRSSELINIH
jgi:hypothetical protein